MNNVDNTKIDVVVATKNELPDWWVKKNLSRVPTNKLIIERSKPLAIARMRAIQKVTTEWFVFIDDDALLGENWWPMIKKHIAEDVGAIEGRSYNVYDNPCINKALNDVKKTQGTIKLRRGERGTTICTLLRRDVVQDWKPSRKDLSAFEDYELTQHVLKKGYSWLSVDSDAWHLRKTLLPFPKNIKWNMVGVLKLQLSPRRFLLENMYYMLSDLLSGIFLKQKAEHNIRLSLYRCYCSFWQILFLLYEGFKQPF